MKKVGLFIAAAIAVAVLLSNLGSLLGLVISLAVLYFAAKGFLKTSSAFSKVLWGVVAIVAAITAVANIPAILGLLAIYVLYVVYKKWNSTKREAVTESRDPFVHFEKQWAELSKKSN
ncbi:hypothetical protein [Jeotgalibacillus soli]|uniref:Flagellar basal body rod protein n=1 Tax=Jeotgalibacillus soli TaxID=889306 RepID=A0A0C2VWB6_9BACL|nr:hypothetical protein [Jeotgalibacillus soli]KIL48278.1 hypothetical protein KP78_17250 [Jeotgalibacillus soli]